MCFLQKQGPQNHTGAQIKNSLRSLKIQKTPPPITPFSFLHPSEMASLSNSRWQNRSEIPNSSSNNGYMVEKANYDVVSESVTSI